eukprot:s2895_g10.t1
MSLSRHQAPLAHDAIRKGMARCSLRSLALFRSLHEESKEKPVPSGAMKRKAQEVLGPFRYCFEPVRVPAWPDGGEDQIFFVADLKKVLDLVCTRCPSMEKMLLSNSEGKLEAVVAHDEATGGNVLNPLLRKKVLLFYVTFVSVKSLWNSYRAWLPLAAISHDQIQKCKGGISAATGAFLRKWSADKLQDPFPIGRNRTLVTVNLKIFISDLDSQRAALAAKGSAALKPCFFCMNVIARYAGDHCSDEDFRTIEEHDLSRCRLYEKEDLEQVMITGLKHVNNMTKKEKELRERVLGYNFDPNSIWACPVSRSLLHIDMIQNDALHCYWSNGICNSEIMLLLQKAEKTVGVTLSALADLCASLVWKKKNCNATSDSIRRLFKECQYGAHGFKGSASDTIAVCALIRWVAESHWLNVPALRGPAFQEAPSLKLLPYTEDFI